MRRHLTYPPKREPEPFAPPAEPEEKSKKGRK